MAKRPEKKLPQPTTETSQKTAVADPFSTKIFSHPMAGFLAAALAILLYFNTFGHKYCLDDVTAISKNTFVQSADFQKIFTTEYRFGYSETKSGMLYRPISLAVLALEWQVAPDSPGFYHFLNVLLYAFLAWLLWLTARRMFSEKQNWLAAAAVFLFVAHPAHTEVVANIKSLDEILAMIFAVAALRAMFIYLQGNNLQQMFSAMFLYALALLSKESAIVFLGVFPLAAWFFSDKKLPEILKTCFLFLLPAGLFLMVRNWVLAQQISTDEISALDNVVLGAPDFLGKLATAFLFFGKYLATVFLPINLVSDLGAAQVKPTEFTDFQAVAGATAFLGMAIFGILQARKKHVVAFAVLFFLTTFSLSTNLFFHIGTSYGERLLFVPIFGFSIFTAWLILKFQEKKWLSPTAANLVLAGILIFYSIKTVSRNPDWKTSSTLCSADLLKSPNSARLNYHYALELIKSDNDVIDDKKPLNIDKAKKAIEYCNKALSFYPNFYTVKETRGLAFYAIGDKERALPDLLEVIAKEPKNTQLPPKIARIYTERNELDKAENVLKKSIAAGVQSADNFIYLGVIYFKLNRREEALTAFKNAQKINPKDNTILQYIDKLNSQ